MWYRNQRGDKFIVGAFNVFVFLTITFMFFGNEIGVTFSIFISALLYTSTIYVKIVGRKLSLANIKDKKFYYREDEGAFSLEFENSGIPIMSAMLRIHMDPNLEPLVIDKDMVKNRVRANQKHGLVEVEVPFSVGYKQKVTINLPFIAKQRGKARISVIEVIIYNPFGHGEVSLIYIPAFKQEAVVFPITQMVSEDISFSTQKEGETAQLHSFHENTLSPIGVRNYLQGDHFKYIDWKATARKQRLQTKLHEKVSDNSLIICLNILEGVSLRSDYEKQLEKIAYLAKSFYKQGISFGLAMNLRTFGDTPFLYIPLGKGKEHLLRVYECLAVVTSSTMTIPYNQVLFRLQRLEILNIIHLGTLSDDHQRIFQIMSRRNYNLYQVLLDGKAITPLKGIQNVGGAFVHG